MLSCSVRRFKRRYSFRYSLKLLYNMRILSIASVFAICGFSAVAAKSAWSFEDATVAMQSQEEGGGVKQIKEK